MSIRLWLIFVALSITAAPAMAQVTSKSREVQEDPILSSMHQPDRRSEEALELPSDPEDSADDKVQEDPLLRPAAASGNADGSTASDKVVNTPVESSKEVQDDPLLRSSPPAMPQKPKRRDGDPARSRDAAGSNAEDEADKAARLIPKPKDKAVQEDPLLRTGTPF